MVQPLSKNGCPISVKEDACDFPERFLVWRESTKIYTESVFTREVGEIVTLMLTYLSTCKM